jgi:hypothetical protein
MWKPLKLFPWFITVGIAWSIGFIYNVYYGGELSWLRMMYDQKQAIAANIQAPKRLLITGGSGAHYTLDSKAIEEDLGIPVINLGLDGPVGLDVILPSMLNQVRSGDIVLLIPEYLILLDEDGFGDRSGQFGVAIGLPGLGNIPAKQLTQDLLLLGVPTLRGITKSGFDLLEKGKLTGYYSDPVSDRGDPTTVKPREGKWWRLNIDDPISPHAVQRITKFRQEVEAKGGSLIISLPWVYGSDDEKSVSNIEKTAEELGKIAPLIYEKDSLNIKSDANLFADTHYHLLPEARKIRAQQLVEELKPLIKVGSKKAGGRRQEAGGF